MRSRQHSFECVMIQYGYICITYHIHICIHLCIHLSYMYTSSHIYISNVILRKHLKLSCFWKNCARHAPGGVHMKYKACFLLPTYVCMCMCACVQVTHMRASSNAPQARQFRTCPSPETPKHRIERKTRET